ncbi:hypothetical protein HYPDE_26293 [Hyphomicrobium denitrificans 1NES1]|uniref:HTH marR-type domain-containing protein n=1 Tax=Hyphomicrobium denitrificans 1NES1 TaxID=670307 RepID=N0B8S7_9HYPH|nr:hypothetical protein [Hyphomicrobium denitrificans]AGK56941.1 hypothetical protein HYPDE_26293 [Hyphomicrobium denitrificans 1NES1]
MNDGFVSAEVGEFIVTHIDSVIHLEALMLLHDAPSQAWTAATMANRIYVSEATADAVLNRLEERGLIHAQCGGLYMFGIHDSNLAALIDMLAEAYRRHLVPVTNLIHSRSKQ